MGLYLAQISGKPQHRWSWIIMQTTTSFINIWRLGIWIWLAQAIHFLYKQISSLGCNGCGWRNRPVTFASLADSQVVTLRRPSGSTITVEEVKITLQRFLTFQVPPRKKATSSWPFSSSAWMTMREVSYFVFPKSGMYQLALLRICFYITLSFCTLLECQRLNTTFLLPVFFQEETSIQKLPRVRQKTQKTFLLWDFQYWQASTAIPDERKFPPFQGKKSSMATHKEKTERWFPFPMERVLKFAHLSWQVLRIFESWGVILSYWSIEKKHIRMSILMWMPMKLMEIHWLVKKYNVRIVFKNSTSASDLEEKGQMRQMELFVLKQQHENGSQPIYFW